MVDRAVSFTPFAKWPFILLVKAGKLLEKVVALYTSVSETWCGHGQQSRSVTNDLQTEMGLMRVPSTMNPVLRAQVLTLAWRVP